MRGNLPRAARVRTPFGGGILGWVRFVRSCCRAAACPSARAACAPSPVVVTPVAAAPPTCPIGGCGAPAIAAATARRPLDVALRDRGRRALRRRVARASARRARCRPGARRRTTAAWRAWRGCSRRRARSTTRALARLPGRLSLDGRGAPRDVQARSRHAGACLRRRRGDGVRRGGALARRGEPRRRGARRAGAHARLEAESACLVGHAESCFQIGVLFYYGREAYPRDRASSSRAFSRGCDLGDSRACNNLGDALAYGDGVGRDVEGASSSFLKACRLGEALGCANLGYMAEHGEGVPRDVPRARGLYRQACTAGDVYGCLHLDLLAAEDAGAPRDPDRALEHWRHACEHGRTRARARSSASCTRTGRTACRATRKSRCEAMTRACDLGDTRACEWVKSHPDD